MENTTKAGAFQLPKIRTRILRTAVLILAVFIVCRGPILEDCFPAAIALIAYMVSKRSVNLYLAIPAAAGIIPYITRGYDPWGDLAAMCVCGIFFIATRRLKLMLWHRAMIAAAIGIVCISIYRLATGTVYKISPEMLLFEGLLIFLLLFIFDTCYQTIESHCSGQAPVQLHAKGRGYDGFRQMPLAALTVLCLLTANGAGLGFLLWPIILFLGLWVLTCADVGDALFVAVTGGVSAALMGQGQWGLTVTMMIGIGLAAFAKRHGTILTTAVFVFACWALQSAESGVVLGIDNYCLFLAAACFLAFYWKFSSGMNRIINILTSGQYNGVELASSQADDLLRMKYAEMEDLAELYATYLDSRSMLANQFDITGQIIEDVRQQISRQTRKNVHLAHEKFDMDIAISQCAASGAINGDCCGWQDIGDGKTAMVVSDGMGKGKKAAAESLMVTKTIIALLKSGVTTDLTLKMINTIMLMKDDEDFYATVDLVIVDRKTGKAKFYKIGAAPTLIRRKSNVEEVKLSAVPLGIVNGLKIRYVETMLKKEDWIIMMSDGVSDGGDGRSSMDGRRFLHQIKETAASVRSDDPRTMSDLILNQAADSYIGRERDDLTVMVARIL